jgi:hypothetical protein
VPAHAQRMSSLLAADRELAHCRESKGDRVQQGARGAGREAGGRRGGGRRRRKRLQASGMHWEGPTQGLRVRARAERTWNIQLMSVTLEVSKLSG